MICLDPPLAPELKTYAHGSYLCLHYRNRILYLPVGLVLSNPRARFHMLPLCPLLIAAESARIDGSWSDVMISLGYPDSLMSLATILIACGSSPFFGTM